MEQPETAVGVLRSLMTTQAQVDSFSDQVIDEVKRGLVNPLEVHIQLNAFSKASDRITKEIKENVMREAAMYPEKSFEVYGAQVTKAPVKTEYDYTACQDEKWNDLKAAFDAAKEALDKRQDFLKAIDGQQNVVTDNGEAATIYPPLKRQVDGIKILIK